MTTGVSTPVSRALRIAASVALTLAVGASCDDDGKPLVGPIDVDVNVDDDAVGGSGTIVAEERVVSGIDRIVLAGEGALVVTFGDAETLTIETDDNLLEYIETEVSGGTLQIQTRSGTDIAPTESVEYEVGVVALEAVELRGAGSIDIGSWSTAAATIRLSGAGDISVDELVADELDIDLPGVGDISVDGTVDEHDVSASGVGEYRAGGLQSGTARIEASGPVFVTVWTTETLDLDVRIPATVEYYGEPEVGGASEGGTITALGPK